MPARITFLGTAGGRFVVIRQIRASGGWVLEMDSEMIHVDPGPGALVRAKQYGVNLSKVTGIIVSHSHPDHCIDAEMVVEAMTGGAKVKRGFLAGSDTIFNGSEGYRPVFSPYHLGAVSEKHVMEEGKTTKLGGIEVKAVPTHHNDPNCLGMVFRGSVSLGFPGDGDFFEEQTRLFKGCDYLLLNTLRPRDKEWPGHMNADGARKLIEAVKPRTAFLQHFGITMLNGVAEREAKWIARETGVETRAARDGLEFELGGSAKEKGQTGVNSFVSR